MKALARLLWYLAPIEAGLRALASSDDWFNHKIQQVGMPIWKAIRHHSVGHTVCYRQSRLIQAKINADRYGQSKFMLT